MKLSLDDLRDVDPLRPLTEVALPDISEWVNARTMPSLGANVRHEISAKSDLIWQVGTQRLTGAVGSQIGFIAIDTFRGVVEAMGVDVYELGSKVLNDLISVAESVEVGMGIALDAMQSIPVVGFVVKLIRTIGEITVRVVHIVRENRRKYSREAKIEQSEFDPFVDTGAVDRLIANVYHTRDWTLAFMPPASGVLATSYTQPFWTPAIEGGGRAFVGTDAIEGAYGYVPNTTYLHQAVEMLGKQHTFFDPGVFLPSVRNQLIGMWSMLGRNEPTLYTVNATKIADVWQNYLFELRRAIEENRQIPNGAKRQTIDGLREGRQPGSSDMEYRFGWDSYGTDRPDYGLDRVGRYKGWPNIRLGAKPLTGADVLARRQYAYLDTLTCAYVDESFAAIKETQMLRIRWEDRRRQLLEHDARYLVDLDMVPDAEYRKELENRGVGRVSGGGLTTTTPGLDRPDLVISAARGVKPPEPEEEPPNLPDFAPGVSTGAVGFLLMGAGAAGLAYYLKKRR